MLFLQVDGFFNYYKLIVHELSVILSYVKFK